MNTIHKLLFVSLSFGLSISNAVADKPKANFPETEIFLFDLDLGAAESKLSNGANVTQRAGYDNQPYFTPNSESFVYSRGDDYQTDVYEYFIASGKIKQLTDSPATEFSPTPTADNSSLTFVSDRNASIWLAQRDDASNPKWLIEHTNNREPIGYYAWNQRTGDILYWSQYGFSVSLTNSETATYHFVTGHAVPSTPQIIPNTDNFSFTHRQSNGQVWIKAVDPKTKSVTPLISIVGSNSNYAWAPDGTVLTIERDILYQATIGDEQGWRQIADLSKFGVQGAYRLAISPNGAKLAVVGLPKEDN